MNVDTHLSTAPPVELGRVMKDVLLRVFSVRQTFCYEWFLRDRRLVNPRELYSAKWVLAKRTEIPINPQGVPTFWYVVDNHVIVVLRLQFGRRSS